MISSPDTVAQSQSNILVQQGVDSETGQKFYDIEKALPLDRLQAAFVSEFSQTAPDIEERLRQVRRDSAYVDRVGKDRSFQGMTFHLSYIHEGQAWSYPMVEATDDRTQDLHALGHEWIHALPVADILPAAVVENGVLKKRWVRSGPLKIEGISVRKPDGTEKVVSAKFAEGVSEEQKRFWEAVTEWRARKISTKYFPDKFPDLHSSFGSGYLGVSVIEWLEHQASGMGRGDEFMQAANEALVNGSSPSMYEVLNNMFPNVDAVEEIMNAFSRELQFEQEAETGKIPPQELNDRVYKEIYPNLQRALKGVKPVVKS